MKITIEGNNFDIEEKVECFECGRKFYLPDSGAGYAEEHGIMCLNCIKKEIHERDEFYSGHGPETMGKRNIGW